MALQASNVALGGVINFPIVCVHYGNKELSTLCKIFQIFCCLPTAAVLNPEKGCFVWEQGTVEVVNIFCLTHCLLCSSQNVFQNIQIHSSQFISTSYLSKKVFFMTMDIIFQFIVMTFL